jgi:hypothetical protein
MEKLSAVFWFLSLPVFIYVSYRLCLLTINNYEKTHRIEQKVEEETEKK